MKRLLLCSWLGHRYATQHHPSFFVCRRCGELGFWIPGEDS